MQISTSKLTQKYQATVPATVRKKLNLHAGDVIAFEIEHDEIRLRKARLSTLNSVQPCLQL